MIFVMKIIRYQYAYLLKLKFYEQNFENLFKIVLVAF